MPEPVILFVVLVLVPLAALFVFSVRRHSSRLDALIGFLFTGSLVLFLFIWGQYPYAGSFYVRYIFPLLLTVAAMRVFRSTRERPWSVWPGWKGGFRLGLQVAGAFIFLVLSWMAFAARSVDGPAIDMQFPLRGSTYYISSGGSNRVLNLHHKPNTPAQMFAIDVDRLDRWGRYSSGLFSERLEDYYIYGDTVYSPCDGTVSEAEDGMPDNKPFDYDPASGSGNHVRIVHDGLQVALLHFAKGSILVRPGDSVRTGDPIGRVGNSGFSTEPHLHLHVSRFEGPDSSLAGVPVRFRGRFLVRNSSFSN